MDKIKITGGNELNGVIPISGAKNAALPLMIASMLTKETLTLDNMPLLADVIQLERILSNHGVDYTIAGKRAGAPATRAARFTSPRARSSTRPRLTSSCRACARASGCIAPLLARMGEARVSLPGGCAIGTRPVDLLLMAMEKLGAQDQHRKRLCRRLRAQGRLHRRGSRFRQGDGRRHAYGADGGLDGARQDADAQRRARAGDSISPTVSSKWARGSRARASRRWRSKASSAHGAHHAVLPDRIEAGTYADGGGDDRRRRDARRRKADLLPAALDALTQAGAHIEATNGHAREAQRLRDRAGRHLDRAVPGFPTDLQAQFMALMTRAKGFSRITETIFENRFMHVQELARLGARIRLDGDSAIVTGADHLEGAQVMATDLRASVSLVIAALAAKGETTINRVYHLDRGFERLEHKLRGCGAVIERVSGQG